MAKNTHSNIEHIHDTEQLYRSINPNKNLYSYVDGKLKFSSAAFNDRKFEPSVDRAILRDNNPHLTKMTESAGVVALDALSIREISVDTPDISHQLDPKAAPTRGNKAHAIITGVPSYKDENGFKKAKKKLALLAEKNGWCIEPINNEFG